MHLSEGRLRALADGEATLADRADAESHLVRCAVCANTLARMRDDIYSETTVLGVIDHETPVVDPAFIMSRARRPVRFARSGLAAAGIALFLLAGVAYAAGSIPWLSRFVNHAIQSTFSPVPIAQSSAPATSPVAPEVQAGVAFAGEDRVDVVFHYSQGRGTIRITFANDRVARITHSGGVAGYVLTRTGATVENNGSTASYEIQVPASASSIDVRIGSQSVFTKLDSRITSSAAADRHGAYIISFASPKPSGDQSHVQQ